MPDLWSYLRAISFYLLIKNCPVQRLLTTLQDSHFQSKLRAHFQKMLQDFTLQEDELEDKLRSALQSALQNTFLDEFLEEFFICMQVAFKKRNEWGLFLFNLHF